MAYIAKKDIYINRARTGLMGEDGLGFLLATKGDEIDEKLATRLGLYGEEAKAELEAEETANLPKPPKNKALSLKQVKQAE